VSRWPGAAAAALVFLVTFGTLGAVAWRAEGPIRLGPAELAAIRFTLVQALLSATASAALAVPLARALVRREFPGRPALVAMLGAPFILPVIVAILGLLAVFGRGGILSAALGRFGIEPIHVYGLHGVVLANVFFNLPLATRLLMQGWLDIPAERFRLASSLGFTSGDLFRTLEWPMLRSVLPGAFLVTFLICTTNFAVALTLGGGPRATTVELAIYQAFRFDFDLSKASLLASIQFALGGTAAALAFRVTIPSGFGAGLDRRIPVRGADTGSLKAQDITTILLASAFLLSPLAMIVTRGLPGLLELPTPVLAATSRSLAVALASTALTLCLALPLAALASALPARRGRPLEALAYLPIAASPLVIGTGLFILVFPVADPVPLALPVTAIVNSVMALPFALRALAPAYARVESEYGHLADSLRMSGWSRMRLLVLPRLRRPIGFAAGLSAALSMGDLGVIALFASPDRATLPFQLYRLMASYRMEDAAAAALLLLICSLALFWIFDRGGRPRADA